MIDKAIQHVVSELNDYINLRSQIGDRAVAGSLFDLEGKANPKTQDKLAVFMVNVEEERTYRSLETYEKKADGPAERVRPPVKVNVHVLFAANLGNYDEAMKTVSQVISFFQHRPAIDYADVPALTDRKGRMTFELFSMTFEQVNHLWGALGGKYMPSVVYKLGILDIQDRQVEAEVPPVEEIAINE